MDDLKNWIGLEVGNRVTLADLQAATDRLGSSGLFSDLRYSYTTRGERLTLLLDVVEAPQAAPVIFDNVIWFADDEIVAAVRKELPFFNGTLPETPDARDLFSRVMQSMINARGIKGRVDLSLQQDPATKRAHYLLTVRGPSPVVCDVAVEGASAGISSELFGAAKPMVGRGYSRRDVGAMAKGALTDIYRQRGYWRASIVAGAAESDTAGCAGARITLQVTEGPLYRWDQPEWSGNFSALGLARSPAAWSSRLACVRSGRRTAAWDM